MIHHRLRIRVILLTTCLLSCTGCGGGAGAQSTGAGPVYPAIEQAKLINFTKLTHPPGAKVGLGGPAGLNVYAPLTVPEALKFYVDQLSKLGWQAHQSPDAPTDQFANCTLDKNGHLVEISILKGGDPPGANVSLLSRGNFDTRKLPRSPGAKPLVEDQAYTWYVTPNSVRDEVKWLQGALAADGWQEFKKMHAGMGDDRDDQQFMELRKQGYDLDIMIATAPAQNNQTVVQYHVTSLSHELPTPPGATDVEFADDTWELKCKAQGDFKQAGEFYQKAMPAAGYKALPSEEPHDTYWNLRFGTPDEDIVMVQTSTKDGQTHVSMYGVPAAVVAKMRERDKQQTAPAKGQP